MHRFKGNVNINKLLLEQNIKTGKPLLTLSLQLSTRDHGMHFLTEEKAWPAKKQHHLDHHQYDCFGKTLEPSEECLTFQAFNLVAEPHSHGFVDWDRRCRSDWNSPPLYLPCHLVCLVLLLLG